MKKFLLILLFLTLACGQGAPLLPGLQAATATQVPSRAESIPPTAHKMTPAEDAWPPIVAEGLGRPEPLPAPINTAGAEDSPFITLDDQTLYFFFTPDLHIPVEKQLLDGMTGIWMSQRTEGGWGEPQRVVLEKPGELALDGCEFVLGDWMVFCSVRARNLNEIDLYTSARKNNIWTDVKNWGKQINLEYQVGEMHISADGQTMVFASKRAGGLGGFDLWTSTKTNAGWSEPVNLGAPVNTAGDENRPYLSPDGQTLWFDSMSSRKGLPGPAIFRSIRNSDGTWGKPEEMISQFVGEPSLSADGHTLYFIHHYFSADLKEMIEADIYVVSIP
ncbi:MAG: PD40 domain-containing protein [Chloroflexi bacterium]|nr:PD40 domain-containing protein [Chloroflexota bacterium]